MNKNILGKILSGGLDPGLMRPFIGHDGRTYMTYKAENGLRTEPVMANGTLRRDEWKQLDQEVLRVSKYRMTGITDLIDAGLTLPLTSPLGVIELEHHTMGESMQAIVSMDPAVRSRKDRPDYGSVFTPIPIIHADFSIGQRALEASRRGAGSDLQTDSVSAAMEVVAERLERMLFADESFTYGRGSIYSYTNYPHRTQVPLAESWVTADPDDILADVQAMIQASIDSRHYGPWHLYLPMNYNAAMGKDYSLMDGGSSVRQRLMQLEGLQAIKFSHFLEADNAVLVEMQTQTVRLIRGLDPSAVQWQTNGGFVNEFKIFCILVPEIRSDHYDRCGIVHLA